MVQRLLLLPNLSQLGRGLLALRQPLLQADDLVFQTRVQLLLVLDGPGLDLELLELLAGQELPDPALDDHDLPQGLAVLLPLEPAADVRLDDDSFRVPQQFQVTLPGEVAPGTGLEQDGSILAPSGC